MKNIFKLTGKTGLLLAGFLFCFGIKAMAAPAVEGDSELTVEKDAIVSADYTITSDGDMESATLTLAYDKDVLTYMSGSGGNNFSGNGGNGQVQLSSKPGTDTASFSVRFKGRSDEDTQVVITACTITVDGKEIDVLNGESLAETEDPDEDLEDESGERASWVIDERTFYLHNPGSMEDFDSERMEIQGIRSRVLKHNELDLYVIKLHSDNGSYRDYFVYNPETGNVVPFVEMESGSDDVILIEPEEDGYVPVRYSYVDMPWGAKYSIPAYKHVIIDGIDEIFDDTNRYLVYGINQEGQKAWYSYDYDANSLQLFDDVAYTGEQNYIEELEESIEGQKAESAHLLNSYNRDMGRRLYIILFMTILIILLLNVVVFQHMKMRKLQNPETDEEHDEPEDEDVREPGEVIVGNLEENETDFREPDSYDDSEDELEIINLDEEDEED